jgi:cob(I)alamin adenosyltransferase
MSEIQKIEDKIKSYEKKIDKLHEFSLIGFKISSDHR